MQNRETVAKSATICKLSWLRLSGFAGTSARDYSPAGTRNSSRATSLHIESHHIGKFFHRR